MPATDIRTVVAWIERAGSKRVRDGMARYAIPADNAVGIPVGTLRAQAKKLGRDHALALALWDTGIYEARLLASFVDEAEKVTPAQMDRWCKDFDNWAVCDTVCFALFDRTPHAFKKVDAWARKKDEFVRRGAFALLASLAAHDKAATDADFLRRFPLIESGARDERNFVKKAVSWALRAIGSRSPGLHAAALELGARLAESEDASARWVGKDTVRDLSRPLVTKRLAAKKKRAG